MYDANMCKAIPTKHRPDSFVELRAAGFIDTASIGPSKPASKPRGFLAKIDQLVIASGERTARVHGAERGLSFLEPSMREYGESEKVPESVFDLALGHARIFVEAKDVAQLGLEDRGKLRC